MWCPRQGRSPRLPARSPKHTTTTADIQRGGWSRAPNPPSHRTPLGSPPSLVSPGTGVAPRTQSRYRVRRGACRTGNPLRRRCTVTLPAASADTATSTISPVCVVQRTAWCAMHVTTSRRRLAQSGRLRGRTPETVARAAICRSWTHRTCAPQETRSPGRLGLVAARPLLSDPPRGPWPAPADPLPPTSCKKMRFVKGAGNLRPILGMQTFFWPLTPPSPPPASPEAIAWGWPPRSHAKGN